MLKIKSFLTKLLQWEHWPTYMFYVPLAPFYIYQTIKARHLVSYLIANPAIKYSGNGTESKFKTIQLIPDQYKPSTVLISENTNFENVIIDIEKANINFPLIAKPDIGFRGYLVKKIDTKKELKSYLEKNKITIIIQEFISYENECGLFYHRMPDETQGKITSITLKKFLTVVGDGTSSLAELILADKRAYLYYYLLQNIHKGNMQSIPEKNKVIQLSVIGNHSKGTQFINGNHLISKDLEQMMDVLSKQINGWFYGRLDIKYNTFEELIAGENFKILEINGIISEPTHIYDPKNSTYFRALKSIKQHWKIIYKIAKKNHETANISYPKPIPYFKNMLWLRKYTKKIQKLNK
jgi:hypothetical protein